MTNGDLSLPAQMLYRWIKRSREDTALLFENRQAAAWRSEVASSSMEETAAPSVFKCENGRNGLSDRRAREEKKFRTVKATAVSCCDIPGESPEGNPVRLALKVGRAGK